MKRLARASARAAVVALVAIALAAQAGAQPPAQPTTPAAPDAAAAPKLRAKLGKAPPGVKLSRGKPKPGAAPAGNRPPWLAGAPPAGWIENPALSRSVATALRQARPFGKLPSRSRAIAYVQPGVGAFYLAWLVVDAPAPDGTAAVRGALDHLRESRVLSSPQANSTEELAYSEELADGMARARLEWRHVSNETLSLVESAVWLSADGKPRLASAECVASTSGGKTPAAVDRACRDAVATFAVAVPPAERGALANLPAGKPVAEPEPEPPAKIADGPRPPSMGPARPGAGDHVLYTGPPAAEREGANRWLVMLGIGLLAAAAYLTLRARRRSETDTAPESEPPEDAESTSEAETETEAEIEADAADDSDPEKSR